MVGALPALPTPRFTFGMGVHDVRAITWIVKKLSRTTHHDNYLGTHPSLQVIRSSSTNRNSAAKTIACDRPRIYDAYHRASKTGYMLLALMQLLSSATYDSSHKSYRIMLALLSSIPRSCLVVPLGNRISSSVRIAKSSSQTLSFGKLCNGVHGRPSCLTLPVCHAN